MTSRQLVANLRNAGPYFLLELVMPGGTLLALLLYFYRNPRSVALIRRRVQRIGRRLAAAWSEATHAFAGNVALLASRALPLNARTAWCACRCSA